MGGDEDKGTEGDWEAVGETGQLYEAELMALRLRGEGIEARVMDQSYRQEPLPLVRSLALVRVFVPAKNAAAARRLLAEPGGLGEDVEEASEPPTQD